MLADKVWIDPQSPWREDEMLGFALRLGVTPALGRLLAFRHMDNPEDALRFLNPNADQLHPPMTMRGMPAAVQRLTQALKDYHKIVIFGDNDVDGTTSTAILYGFLKKVGARVQYYLPDRMKDGFGLNPLTVDKVAALGAQLVVTVDTGSTAVDEVKLLSAKGIDLIITDHHRFGAEVPQAVAVVNPQQPDCPYPFKELSAAGVIYKVICALDEHLEREGFYVERGLVRPQTEHVLDLVALATVADLCPLVDENRVLVKLGLEQMNTHPRPGLAGLIKEANLRGGVSPVLINYKLAPKINALGRIGDPAMGVRLLLTRSFSEGRRLAGLLVEVNRARQEIEREPMLEAQAQAEAQAGHEALVLVGENWHPGVVGIIAARMAAQFQKPTVALTLRERQLASGSARGLGSFNVLRALSICAARLSRYGGHANAAGLALTPGNLEAFTREFRAAIQEEMRTMIQATPNNLNIESWMTPQEFGAELIGELARLAPFGQGNPEPIVAVRAMALQPPMLYNNRHLKFRLNSNSGEMDAFVWDHDHLDMDPGSRYDLALTPQVSHQGPNLRTKLKMVDLRLAQ